MTILSITGGITGGVGLAIGFWLGASRERESARYWKWRAGFWRSSFTTAMADAKLWEGTHALAVQQLRTERERRFSVQSDVQFEDTSRGLPS